MRLTRRDFLQLKQVQPITIPSNDPILHLLNRTTWGPRPEEVIHVRQIGIPAYIDEQLQPDTIANLEPDKKLRKLPILQMDRPTIYSLANHIGRSGQALHQGFLLRAVHSKQQLLERMVEFWTDHFNVPFEEENGAELIIYHQKIRQHALGNFRDLLFATAKSPAMLHYLDNAFSTAEHPNENYARELMELHTLGVDGGYTEQDVIEVARAFTGWTVRSYIPEGFFFESYDHDTDSKIILGHRFPSGRGIEDGLHVLSLLANHPTTARYVSRKLCRRFVSDQPPQSLIDSTTQVWLDTNGHVPSILRHILLSSEFTASVGQKYKRPLDFLMGALRATGGTFINYWRLYELYETLGQPPYGWQPPDGYPDVAEAWYSTNGLLNRWNTAMLLTHTAFSDGEGSWGIQTQIGERVTRRTTTGQLVDDVSEQVFGQSVTGNLRETFLEYLEVSEDAPVTAHLFAQKYASLWGVMLASPAFQWR